MSKFNLKLMDGAMGTMLLSHGAPTHACLEEMNLSRPRLIEEIHRSYLACGSEWIVANTFGANRPRLEEHHLGKKLEAVNRAGVEIALRAARAFHPKRKVLASIGPLGARAKKMDFAECFRHFREQAKALEQTKPHGFLIETMTILNHAEAAVLAVREVSERLIIASMAFPSNLDTSSKKTGETMEIISTTLRSAGADVLGINCGIGPADAMPFLKALSLVDHGPFCVRPSAGLPDRLLTPGEFSDWALKFRKMGCEWIGGCCGTTPAYIRAIKESL